MRPLALVLLACALVRAEEAPRTVADILDAHAAALGDWARVTALRAESEVRSAGAAAQSVQTAWRLPGRCVRTFRGSGESLSRVEYFGPDGAYVATGAFERYRPGQRSTRAGYYLARAMAEPFPLRRWLGRDAAATGLSVGSSDSADVDVLVAQPDLFGVRAVFLLDRESGHLLNLRCQTGEDAPLVNITFGGWRRVDGVALPHRVDATIVSEQEDEEKQAYVSHTFRRLELRRDYVVEADLSGIDFTAPGRGKDGGEAFLALTFPTGADPYECGVGDLDRDGQPDIAVACDGGLAVTFGGSSDIPVLVPLGGGHHRGLVIDDLDRDGVPEVLTTSWVEPAGMLFRVRFDAERRPAVETSYVAPRFCWSMATGDFDRDGIPDLLLSGLASRSLDIKWGDGTGAFRIAAVRWPLATADRRDRRGFGVAVGRLGAGPHDDLAVCDGRALVLFQGQENGAFLPTIDVPMPEGFRPVAVAMADLDGDARDDLVCAGALPDADLRHDLVIVRNRGDRLEPRDLVAAGVRTEDVIAVPLDGDARPDLAVASFLSGEVTVLLNDGEGGFGPTTAYATGRGTCRLAAGDWDGDGRTDLVATNRLDDTVTVLLNRIPGGAAPSPSPPRARPATPGARAAFRLEGLSAPYEFAAEFVLPEDILDPSGLTALAGTPAVTSLVLVSDKEPSLFRATLDRTRERLLVGPRIPLRGLEGERLDLEGVTADPHSPNLFLACEADSTVVRASLFGTVLGRVPTGVESEGNDGIEAIALRRKPDNTPLLYVFKERWGTTLRPPPVRCFGIRDDPFLLVPRGEPFALPLATPDQTGAAVDGDRCFVVGRLQRRVFEFRFDGDAFAKEARYADFGRLSDNELGLLDPDTPMYGLVEGIAIDPRCGDLFLLVDHNGKVIGREGANRAAAGRLLWFRRLVPPESRPAPRRVALRAVVVADEQAARECWRRARAGEDLAQLAEEYRAPDATLPLDLRVVHEGIDPLPGERRVGRLAPALRHAAFALAVGEVTLCEYHPEECPDGWVVLLRTE